MGIEKATALVEELIEKAGGCAVIAGGTGTQLEKHGASFTDRLWSAVCLIKEPHLIKKVHLEYLEAGADFVLTSSYQATIPGFLSKGLSIGEAELLIEKSVKLAIEARDQFWDSVSVNEEHNYNRALVTASVGSYGAYLADGSEYRGNYGQDVGLARLKDFHRRKLQVLAAAGPDLIAFEVFSNKLETQAIVELLEEENIQIPSSISFTCVDGENAPSGESFDECLDVINKSNKVALTGINCAPPHYVEPLIRKFKKLTEKAIIVFPNNGEVWDGKDKRWLPHHRCDDEAFAQLALRWRDAGAKLVGGCCRTTPLTIRAVCKAFQGKP